jgi:maleate cis-trans isomerase
MAGNVPLGVIVPSVNTVVENWYPKIVPDGVSVHFARTLIADGSSPEEIIAMDREDGVHAIHQIATCRPRAIAYGCTASSIVQGHVFDERLRAEIRHIAEAPATTATDSIFAACRALGLKRVTSISPYTRPSTRPSTGSSPRAVLMPLPTRISASLTGSASPSRKPRQSWTRPQAPGTHDPTG